MNDRRLMSFTCMIPYSAVVCWAEVAAMPGCRRVRQCVGGRSVYGLCRPVAGRPGGSAGRHGWRRICQSARAAVQPQAGRKHVHTYFPGTVCFTLVLTYLSLGRHKAKQALCICGGGSVSCNVSCLLLSFARRLSRGFWDSVRAARSAS